MEQVHLGITHAMLSDMTDASRALAYRLRHPDKVRESKRAYRARLRAQRKQPTPKVRQRVPGVGMHLLLLLKSQGDACALCQQPLLAAVDRNATGSWVRMNTGRSAAVHERCWNRERARERRQAHAVAAGVALPSQPRDLRPYLGTPCGTCGQVLALELDPVRDLRPCMEADAARHRWCALS